MRISRSSLLTFLVVGVVIAGLIFLSGMNFSQNHAAIPAAQKPQLFSVGQDNNNPLDILATTLPQFALSLLDGKFANIWQADAAGRNSAVHVSMEDITGIAMPSDTTFDSAKKQLIITPHTTNSLKPGMYSLNIKIKTVTGKDITVTQDFRWGVLAINTSKSVYKPGETVKLGMGVLDDLGNTKCIAAGDIAFTTAKVWVTIISPTGKEQKLSTEDGGIVGSKECSATSVTNNPDFQAQVTAGQEVGKYTIRMIAENINGKRSVDDFFFVSNVQQPFEILRTSYPTRIYPFGHYPVEITVIAHKNYSGVVSDSVPSNFIIGDISNGGSISESGDFKQINWQVTLQEGQTYTLHYTINFPHVSPEFYLVGPLTVGSFSEGREWQIASDVISQVHEDSNSVNSGTTVTVVWPSITANHLEVQICMETGSATISTPTRGSGSPRPNSWSTGQTVTSTPRMGMWYRNSTVNDNLTFTCTFSSSTGVKAIIVYEYSGIATSTQRDGHSSLVASAACNSSPFQATVALTATNGNELVISAHEATTSRTVNSHSAGFNQEYAFNGTTGTFTSATQTITLSGSYPDTVTLSGSGGTCSAVNVSYITPITVTQNGYRFFQNANNIAPGTPIDVQNTDVTLATPHQPFRVRILLDIDSNQTLNAGVGDWILQYAPAPTSGDCSTLQDSDWNPVDNSTTAIAYNTNSLSGGSNTNISSSGNDPTDTSPHTYTDTYENYYESFAGDGTDDVSNIQASLTNNLAGVFDFSLLDNTDDSLATTYCLELVNADGAGNTTSNLDAYLRYPKVTTFYNEVNIKSGTTINGGTTIN